MEHRNNFPVDVTNSAEGMQELITKLLAQHNRQGKDSIFTLNDNRLHITYPKGGKPEVVIKYVASVPVTVSLAFTLLDEKWMPKTVETRPSDDYFPFIISYELSDEELGLSLDEQGEEYKLLMGCAEEWAIALKEDKWLEQAELSDYQPEE